MSGGLRVLVACNDYPSVEHPHRSTFVGGLVSQWGAAGGARVAVVSPRAHWRARPHEIDAQAAAPIVLRPGFTSLSSRDFAPGVSSFRWTIATFTRAVRRAARSLSFEPELCYGHFLFPAGHAALRAAQDRGLPAVVALGESDMHSYERKLGRRFAAASLDAFQGILSVSAENRDFCVERLGIAADRIRVVPNAADPRRFRPLGRAECRRRLGLPEEGRIVAFTGHFIERKGPLRLLAALERCSVPGVGAFFLGEGSQRPAGERVLFAGRVPHEEVPIWLGAADCFAMPTLAEGSPNALIEALACGLPIVSSAIRSVEETVDESSALLVDPRDTNALAAALDAVLGDDERRSAMSKAALERAAGRSQSERSAQILEWLTEIAGLEQ